MSNGLLSSPTPKGKDRAPAWVSTVGVALKIGLVVAAVYLAAVFWERWSRPPLRRPRSPTVNRPADYYVYPPKSYVSDAASARKLIGKPLWVKEGYRWIYEPDDVPLDPLEKIIPTRVRERGEEVFFEFQKNEHTCALHIGSKRAFYVDEIFFLKDPRELYDHWPPEVWRKIEAHQVELGMTEHQIVFALGAGNVMRSSPSHTTRVVEYTLCRVADLQPVRVTYQDGIAEQIEKLPLEPD